MAHDATEKGAEQRLGREVVADFFQTEQNATDGSTKSYGDTACGTRAQDLSSLAVVVAVLGYKDLNRVAGIIDDDDAIIGDKLILSPQILTETLRRAVSPPSLLL